MRSCSKSRSSSTIRSRQGFGSIEASVSNPTVGCKAITPIPSAGRRAAAASPAPTRRGSYTPAPAPGPAPAGGGSPHHRPPRRQPARRRTPAAAGAAAAPRRSTGPRPPSPAPPARDRPRPGTRRRSTPVPSRATGRRPSHGGPCSPRRPGRRGWASAPAARRPARTPGRGRCRRAACRRRPRSAVTVSRPGRTRRARRSRTGAAPGARPAPRTGRAAALAARRGRACRPRTGSRPRPRAPRGRRPRSYPAPLLELAGAEAALEVVGVQDSPLAADGRGVTAGVTPAPEGVQGVHELGAEGDAGEQHQNLVVGHLGLLEGGLVGVPAGLRGGLLRLVAPARTLLLAVRGLGPGPRVSRWCCPLLLSAARRVLRDLRRCAGEGRPDLVDVELVHRALHALAVLVGPLLEAALDDDADALGEGLGDVLGGLPPHRAGEEEGVAVLPLAGLLVVDPRGGGDAELGDGGPGRGEAQLGIVDQVADDGDDGLSSHQLVSFGVREASRCREASRLRSLAACRWARPRCRAAARAARRRLAASARRRAASILVATMSLTFMDGCLRGRCGHVEVERWTDVHTPLSRVTQVNKHVLYVVI